MKPNFTLFFNLSVIFLLFRNSFSKIILQDHWIVLLDGELRDELGEAFNILESFARFENVLRVYSNALERLAAPDSNKPEVVIIAISEETYKKCHSIERKSTEEERKTAARIKKSQSRRQPDLLDLLREVE